MLGFDSWKRYEKIWSRLGKYTIIPGWTPEYYSSADADCMLHTIRQIKKGNLRGDWWEAQPLGAGWFKVKFWWSIVDRQYSEFIINTQKTGGEEMKVEIIAESPAFVLSARDWNGQGEEIAIPWSELKNAPEGKSWHAQSGNMLRECVSDDILTVVHRRSDGTILCRHDSYFVGGYPDYEESEESQFILFVPAGATPPAVDEGIEVIREDPVEIPKGEILAGSPEKPTVIYNTSEDVYYILDWF